MERAITEHDLALAISHILSANAVPDPLDAVQVLSAPGNGTRFFAIIASEQAGYALEEVLARLTGHRYPNAGEAWIVDEAQGLALIKIAEDGEPLRG